MTTMQGNAGRLSWIGILRLGLVQAALGSIVVLVTSTLNRVMVVEYALPATIPGVLVALHYAVQMIRPRFGYGSDRGGRRTPWIVGGMATLAVGGILCAVSATAMSSQRVPALLLAVLAYVLVGFGVGAAGTSLLVLLANRVDAQRRAAAATIMWVLMIAGFAVTSTSVGHFLDPYSAARLIGVTAVAAAAALLVAVAAVWNIERRTPALAEFARPERHHAVVSFRTALRSVWSEPQAQRFTLFVFVSMLAYSAQELLLEPFCGLVFGYTLGESARAAGAWHAGVFIGMVAVGIICSGRRRWGTLRAWTIAGCCASAVSILSLVGADLVGAAWPLRESVIALGLSNGVFAVAAIGSMMELAHTGTAGSAGTRMGLWGAAQAVAFALGGVCGSVAVDVIRHYYGAPVIAFGVVFGAEALLFLGAAGLAARVGLSNPRVSRANVTAVTA